MLGNCLGRCLLEAMEGFAKILTTSFEIFKIVVFNNIEKHNSSAYVYDLDMSYAAAGVYLIKIGNSAVGYKTGRIIVK